MAVQGIRYVRSGCVVRRKDRSVIYNKRFMCIMPFGDKRRKGFRDRVHRTCTWQDNNRYVVIRTPARCRLLSCVKLLSGGVFFIRMYRHKACEAWKFVPVLSERKDIEGALQEQWIYIVFRRNDVQPRHHIVRHSVHGIGTISLQYGLCCSF